MAELTYKMIRDFAREEKAQPGLCKLPPDFYASLQDFLKSKFSEIEANRSLAQMKEFENAIATVRELASIRQQKLLFRALRSGGQAESALPEMTREEYETYDRFKAIVRQENEKLEEMLRRFEERSKPEAESTGPGKESPRLVKLRFIKEVQEYVGSDKTRFGPFKPGQESFLPEQEAELLLKHKLAEAI